MSVHATSGLPAPTGPPPHQHCASVTYLHRKPHPQEDHVAPAVPEVPEAPEDIGLAAIFEALFRSREQSLSDPATAAVFRTSLEGFLLLLNAARRGGTISQDQYNQLGATLGLANRFPDII